MACLTPLNLLLRSEVSSPDGLTWPEMDGNWTAIQDFVNDLCTQITALQLTVPQTGDIKLRGLMDTQDGWLYCNGTAISRVTYSALFAKIGIAFGPGNGASTFNLPDMRGRVPVGNGQGSGLTNRVLGTTIGDETYTDDRVYTIDEIEVTGDTPELTGTVSASGTVTIPALTVNVTSLSGTAASGTTGSTALSISDDGSDISGTFTATNSYTPTGTVAITGITMAAPAFVSGTATFTATNSYTPTGTISAVNFVNATISGTIAEAAPGHNHDVIVPAMAQQYSEAPNNIPAAPGTYTTDNTIVSINLALQSITFGGSQTPTFTATNSYTPTGTIAITGITMAAPAFVSGTATFTATNSYTPTGTVTVPIADIAAALSISPDPHTHSIPTRAVTGTGAGVTVQQESPSETFTGTCSIDAAPLVDVTASGSTDPNSVDIPLIQPSTVVAFYIKT